MAVGVSARTGEGIPELRAAILEAVASAGGGGARDVGVRHDHDRPGTDGLPGIIARGTVGRSGSPHREPAGTRLGRRRVRIA